MLVVAIATSIDYCSTHIYFDITQSIFLQHEDGLDGGSLGFTKPPVTFLEVKHPFGHFKRTPQADRAPGELLHLHVLCPSPFLLWKDETEGDKTHPTRDPSLQSSFSLFHDDALPCLPSLALSPDW